MKRRILTIIAFVVAAVAPAVAQQAMGTPGLIHVPSADMDTAGVARIGAHYVDQHMVPDKMTCDGEKFNTMTNYLSITPFRWVEFGYGYTLWKLHKNLNPDNGTGFYAKDRYFSLRVQLLYETGILPAVVVGGNDVWGSNENGESSSNYYRNFYAAASKHVDLGGYILGAHLSYRRWKKDYNSKWNGLVGGITCQPSFCQKLRLVGEFDGFGINVGADCELFRYLLLQASLQECKYFSAGLALRIGLL